MKNLWSTLRARLVVAIALIGLLAVVAAWLASRQVALEEVNVRNRLAGEESVEMALSSAAVDAIAEIHAQEDGWTPRVRRASVERLRELVDALPAVEGYELLDVSLPVASGEGQNAVPQIGPRVASSYPGAAPLSPAIRIEIYREPGLIGVLDLHAASPTPPDEQKVVVLQHDTVDVRPPAPRAGLLVASAVALLTLVLLVGVVLRLTKPLRAMSETVTRFGAGDGDARLEVRGDDEIARLGRAFNAMADALAENEMRRRNLVNDVAHELRTPLTNLRFRLESVLDGVAEPTPDEVSSMHADTVRLQRLVEDLQMLATAEAGGLSLSVEPVRVRELVQRLADSSAALSQATVVNEVPAGIIALADPSRLEQVLSNLLANAACYAPGSAVRVTGSLQTWEAIESEWEPVLSRSLAFRASASDAFVSLRVRDQGPGIPEEALPFVFDRFYRVDSSRDRSTGGTGLGLAVVRQLVEAQGGCVAVRSEPGAGAEFLVVLPAADGNRRSEESRCD